MLPEGGSVNRGLLLPPLERDVSESEAEAAAQHGLRKLQDALVLGLHTSSYVSIRQHTSVYVSIRSFKMR
jgi:hypothetical protein